MDNINLLPDDLQKEEDKITATGATPPSLNLYIPQDNQPQKPVVQPAPSPVNPAPKKIVTEIYKPTPNPAVNPVPSKMPPSALDAMDKEVLLRSQESKKNFSTIFSSKNKGKILKSEVEDSFKPDTNKPFNVNLIPEGSDLISNKKLYNYIILRGVYAVILVVLIYAGLLIVNYVFQKQDDNLSQTLVQDEAKFKELEKANNDLINNQKQFSQLETLFNAHIYWTKFFTFLEKVTIPQVYYNDIKASLDGSITITATTDSYLSVARQYLVYQNSKDLISSVSVTDLNNNSSDGTIKFTVVLGVKPEIFFNNPTKP